MKFSAVPLKIQLSLKLSLTYALATRTSQTRNSKLGSETNRNRKPQYVDTGIRDILEHLHSATAIPGASRVATKDYKVLLQQPKRYGLEMVPCTISLAMLGSGLGLSETPMRTETKSLSN